MSGRRVPAAVFTQPSVYARTLLYAAAAAWIAALPLRALTRLDNPRDGHSGIDALLMGWLVGLGGSYAWFANPLMLLALVLKEPRLRMVVAAAAFATTLTALRHPQVCWDDGCRPARLRLGAWLWIAAAAMLLLSRAVSAGASRKPHPPA